MNSLLLRDSAPKNINIVLDNVPYKDTILNLSGYSQYTITNILCKINSNVENTSIHSVSLTNSHTDSNGNDIIYTLNSNNETFESSLIEKNYKSINFDGNINLDISIRNNDEYVDLNYFVIGLEFI